MRPQQKNYKIDWDTLQKPGLSPDYVPAQNELGLMYDTAFERSDWIPTAAAKALFRNNLPLLAYIAGKAPALHHQAAQLTWRGQTVEKQAIIINDSRVTVDCDASWSLGLTEPIGGEQESYDSNRPAGAYPGEASPCPPI